MIDYGLPYHPDMFSTGETSHGCGDVPRTVHQGIRTTAADFITKTYRRDNITIKTEVTVDKIIMSRDSGELSATGVATISKAGKKIVYQASKEIIVTAGAYCSPPILMRSGLGPKEQLEKHDIECLVDLPGVGSNLQDHVVCLSLFSVLLHSKTYADLNTSSSSSSTKFPNQTSQTTTLPTTTMLSPPLTPSIKKRKQASCPRSPSEYSDTPALTHASPTPRSGATPLAPPAVTLWASHQISPTWSSGIQSSTAGLSNILISLSTTSTRLPCVICSSISGRGAA